MKNPLSILTLSAFGDLHVLRCARRGIGYAAQQARDSGGFLDRNH